MCRQWLKLLFAASLLAGCSSPSDLASGSDLGSRKIKVVTTTSMLTDLVQQLGGDRVQVTGLMGPGVDPHLYKASAGDMSRISSADVVFYNGLHLEGKMGDVFQAAAKRVKTIAVTDCLDPELDLLLPPSSDFEGSHDPHVWFDVSLWIKIAGYVRDTLIQMDPLHEETYRLRAEKYLTLLRKLHVYVKQKANEVPRDQRVLITAHDAFSYFARAYSFKVRGLQGVSTAAEAGVRDVQELASFIAERKIPAIFVESSVSPQTLQAVQAAVKAQGWQVAIGGELYSDALGSPDSPEGTYDGMVRHNIDTIVAALIAK